MQPGKPNKKMEKSKSFLVTKAGAIKKVQAKKKKSQEKKKNTKGNKENVVMYYEPHSNTEEIH